MIVRARLVVPMEGPPIENGAVSISGERIREVGKFRHVAATNHGETIDLGEQAMLPGLINAHCHLDYTCLRRKIPRQKSFTDWIRAINSEKAALSRADYIESIKEGFSEAAHFGTTTIANLTAFPELASQMTERIRAFWFAELIDVRAPLHSSDGLASSGCVHDSDIVTRAAELLRSKNDWGLAPHAPFTASAQLYRRCEEVGVRENVPLTTHLSESSEELQMFRDANGLLYDFLRKIDRKMDDCGKGTPVRTFLGALGERGTPSEWMLVHLNELTEGDFNLFAASKRRFSVVHCPRSHTYFGHSPFEAEKLRQLRVNLCLGTDSLASNSDLNLFAEMRQFQKIFAEVPAVEILQMITTNPARALQREKTLGKIAPGFAADLIAIPCASISGPFDEIVAYDGNIGWSMIAGVIQRN